MGVPSTSNKIKLYIAEEQQILREAYLPFFASSPGIEVVGSSGETSAEALVGAVKAVKPDALLLGAKLMHPDAVKALQTVRESAPALPFVLLAASYDLQAIKALREMSRGATGGYALLLKHSIDTVEQIARVVFSVVEGRVIVDPMVMHGLISTEEASASFLKELSPRELEVLGWMAKGYRNDTIADVLSLDLKTIERHINNIYSKLGKTSESTHQRVYAVMSYLRATGQLPPEQFARR